MAQWTVRLATSHKDFVTAHQASDSIQPPLLAAGSSGAAPSRQQVRFAPWVVEITEVLQSVSGDSGARAVEAIKEQLLERDQ